ncbi:MAG: DNA-binding response OmpR family regulator [Nitrospinales bacterium]|jgi:DNA-binding response OmpR family regulator
MNLKILCIDNSLETLAELVMYFEPLGHKIHSVNSQTNYWDVFVANDIDIVVLSQQIDSESCIDIIDEFQLVKPKIGIFVLTKFKNFEFAVKCLNRGIWGLIEEPINSSLLLEQVDKKLKKEVSNNPKKVQNSELIQCGVCTKVNFLDFNELHEDAWIPLNQFLENAYQLQLKEEFCLSCNNLTIDQVEKHITSQFKKLKQGEINLNE